MVDKTSKIVSWVMYVLLILSALFGVLFYLNKLSSGFLIQWGIILVIVSVIIAILSPIVNFISNPGNIVKILVAIVGILIVGFISYSIAGNNFSQYKLEILGVTAKVSKLVGAGLIFTYIIAGFSLLAILYSSVMKFIK